jgi:SNF2 family DNA or RNA helicase
LGLELEEPATFEPGEAVRFVTRLSRFKGDVSGPGLAAFQMHGALSATMHLGGPGADGKSGKGGQPWPSIDIAFATADGKRRADPAKVLAAWQAGESMVPLLEGGFAPLPSGWLARFGGRLLDLLAARDTAGAVPRAVWPALADFAEELGATVPEDLAALRDRLSAFDRLPAATLPSGLNATLRTYQRHGVDWLAYLRSISLGALLADDMGLGKTLQTIAVLSGRTLVVAPTSVLFNWRAELARFRPELSACLYHGAHRSLDQQAAVVITTYALLRLDADVLAGQDWDIVVLDEAQALKNPESQLARAARRLKAGFRVALSGTPVENRLDDLWSLMQILNPGLLGDRRHFQERYVRPILGGDVDRASALRARVKPFVLRRLKREVAPELPPRTDTVRHVELSAAERTHYDIIRAATRKDVLEQLAAGGGVIQALEALLRLRQACCHPDLLPGVQGESSAKLATLVEILEEAVAEGHKALVFSQWTSFLDLMEPALKEAGLTWLRLDGSTADRQGVVSRFQQEGGPPVLIMSLKAGGVGLNLTAADHVILADPWWNPAAEDQAADRAHRIGQERPVLVQRLVALGTVEEKILALQAAKRALADAVVGEGGAAAGLTREDLMALLD